MAQLFFSVIGQLWAVYIFFPRGLKLWCWARTFSARRTNRWITNQVNTNTYFFLLGATRIEDYKNQKAKPIDKWIYKLPRGLLFLQVGAVCYNPDWWKWPGRGLTINSITSELTSIPTKLCGPSMKTVDRSVSSSSRKSPEKAAAHRTGNKSVGIPCYGHEDSSVFVSSGR